MISTSFRRHNSRSIFPISTFNPPYMIVLWYCGKELIRRPNLRRFAEQNDVEYYVHDTAWLINFDDFMSKINPQGEQVKCEMPLLRNKHDSLIRFNRTHKYAVDKHTIDRCTASDNVSKFLHGRIWIINYRELEKEIERRVEEGSEKKREKLWNRHYNSRGYWNSRLFLCWA